MANTENQVVAATTTTGTSPISDAPEKTFTQDDVDGIVQERLARERAKYADYEAIKEKADKYDELEEQNKSELQKATDKASALQKELDDLKKADAIREIREAVAKDTGVPVSLLTKDTEEECEAQAKEIMDFAKPAGYPQVSDGGEASNFTGKQEPRDTFAEWFNKNDKK